MVSDSYSRRAGLTMLAALVILTLLGAGIAGGWIYLRRAEAEHRARLAQIATAQKAAEEAAEAARVAAQKAQEERQARERAETEARRAAEAAAREQERQVRLARAEADRRQAAESTAARDAYQDVVRRMRSAPVVRMSSAPRSARPGTAPAGTVFVCFLVDSVAGEQWFRYVSGTNRTGTVERLDADGVPHEYALDIFRRQVGSQPALFLLEGTAWLSIPRRSVTTYPVPDSGRDFRPGREELGSLYDFIAAGGHADAIRYDVRFDLSEAHTQFVWQVAVDEGVSRQDIADEIARLAERATSARQAAQAVAQAKQREKKKIATLYNGSDLVKKDIKGTTIASCYRENHGVNQKLPGPGGPAFGNTGGYGWNGRTHWQKVRSMREENAADAAAQSAAADSIDIPVLVDSVLAAGHLTFAPAVK